MLIAQLMRDALRHRDHVRAGSPHAGQRPVEVCTVLSQAAQDLLHRIQHLWQVEVVVLARGKDCRPQRLGTHVVLGPGGGGRFSEHLRNLSRQKQLHKGQAAP